MWTLRLVATGMKGTLTIRDQHFATKREAIEAFPVKRKPTITRIKQLYIVYLP